MDRHNVDKPILVEEINYNNPYDFSQMHRHNYFEIMLFTTSSNKGENIIDFKHYPISKHSLHIICPNQVHLLKRETEDNGLLLQFTKDYLIQSLQKFNPEWLFLMQTNPLTKLTKQQCEEILILFRQIKNTLQDTSSLQHYLIKHLFSYTFFNILNTLNNNPSQEKTNNTTIQFLYLTENQFKNNRTIANYAQQMNISPSKLRKIVVESLGKTPLQVLQDLTKLEIKRLLLIEQLSHKEIAFELNFDSTPSYNRFVKKHFYCTPRELQNNLHKL